MTRKRNPRKAAKHLPRALQDIAFSKNPKPRLAQRRRRGKFGAASPGRSILKKVEDGER